MDLRSIHAWNTIFYYRVVERICDLSFTKYNFKLQGEKLQERLLVVTHQLVSEIQALLSNLQLGDDPKPGINSAQEFFMAFPVDNSGYSAIRCSRIQK